MPRLTSHVCLATCCNLTSLIFPRLPHPRGLQRVAPSGRRPTKPRRPAAVSLTSVCKRTLLDLFLARSIFQALYSRSIERHTRANAARLGISAGKTGAGFTLRASRVLMRCKSTRCVANMVASCFVTLCKAEGTR